MKKHLKVIIIVICFLACGVVYSCGKTEIFDLESSSISAAESEPTDETDPTENHEAEIETESETDTVIETEEEIRKKGICVYVCGAVVSPDVYEMDREERIVDAVRRAGGFTQEADADYLNLAETLCDGMKIYVPTMKEVSDGYSGRPEVKKEVPASESDPEGNAVRKININTADIETLKHLKGVGDSRAEDIIKYRENNGGFKRPEDIMLVPGIKNGMYEKIKDDIEV